MVCIRLKSIVLEDLHLKLPQNCCPLLNAKHETTEGTETPEDDRQKLKRYVDIQHLCRTMFHSQCIVEKSRRCSVHT